MILISYFPLLFVYPLKAQEGYTVKEIIERVERKVDSIDGKLDTKYKELWERTNNNDKRIAKLEYTVYLVVAIAVFLSPYVRELVAFMFKGRNNNPTSRIPMEQVDWQRPKDGQVKKK
jgi:hypothetical protein